MTSTIQDKSLRQVDGSGLLSVNTAGESGKPAVVFIHGLGGSSLNWEASIVAAKLQEEFQVITFDLRGHGLSPLGSGKLTFDDYVKSVGAVMSSVNVSKASLVAHSMGGLVATHFAAQNPDKVEKLVLVGGVKAFADPGKKALRDRAATVQQGGMSAIAATVTTASTSEHTKASRPLETSVVRASLLTTPADGYAAACLALADATEPDYSAINAPTLILAGSEDKTCPKPTVEFLTKNINGAKVVDINNIGHWHEVEDYARVGQELASFL